MYEPEISRVTSHILISKQIYKIKEGENSKKLFKEGKKFLRG